jgi:carbon catabolite-derepressing protein kinase
VNIQLYMVDSTNFLVDFHHKLSYKASTEPGAGKFDMHIPDIISETSSESGERRSLKDKDNQHTKEDEVVSPFVFMDVACRVILMLAGGGE